MNWYSGEISGRKYYRGKCVECKQMMITNHPLLRECWDCDKQAHLDGLEANRIG